MSPHRQTVTGVGPNQQNSPDKKVSWDGGMWGGDCSPTGNPPLPHHKMHREAEQTGAGGAALALAAVPTWRRAS